MSNADSKYTDPQMRERIKEDIKQSDKGGKPGQWSARKAQLLAQEYEKQGGGYVGGPDSRQKHLSKWTKEQWQTKEGSANARKSDGTTKRYLPKKAWKQLSDKEKQQTDSKKQQGSKQGKQFVGNTSSAKQAGANARKSS